MKRLRLPLPPEVSAIYQAAGTLSEKYKEYGRKFTPDGHLVGSIGEVIAAEGLGLTLYPSSHAVHDAKDEFDRNVQIKMTAGNKISMYSCCERLVVLKIISTEEAEVIYDGDGDLAWKNAGKIQKNGQRTISISRLVALSSGGQ